MSEEAKEVKKSFTLSGSTLFLARTVKYFIIAISIHMLVGFFSNGMVAYDRSVADLFNNDRYEKFAGFLSNCWDDCLEAL